MAGEAGTGWLGCQTFLLLNQPQHHHTHTRCHFLPTPPFGSSNCDLLEIALSEHGVELRPVATPASQSDYIP